MRERGATVVELFVWMAIAFLIVSVIASFMLGASTSMAAMRSVAEAQSQATQAVRSVLNDVRDATGTCACSGLMPPGSTCLLCLRLPGIKVVDLGGGVTETWWRPDLEDRVQYIAVQYTENGTPTPRRELRRQVSVVASGSQRPGLNVPVVVARSLSADPTFDTTTVPGAVRVTISTQFGEWRFQGLTMQFSFPTVVGMARYRDVPMGSIYVD